MKYWWGYFLFVGLTVIALGICLISTYRRLDQPPPIHVIIENYPSKPACWIVKSNNFFARRGGIGVGSGYQPEFYFTGNNIAIATSDPNQIVKSFNLDPNSCRVIQAD